MNRLFVYSKWFSFLCMFFIACQDDSVFTDNNYHYIPPRYNLIDLKFGKDTLSFTFPDSRYYKIQTFNVFNSDSIRYISFFDSKEIDNKKPSILVYNFFTQTLAAQIPITRLVGNKYSSYTSVYVKTFDSILVFNDKKLLLYDSAGGLKKRIDLLKATPQMQYYNTGSPPVFIGNKLYTGVIPLVTRISFDRLRNENVLYGFDLNRSTAGLYYKLPAMYYSQYYGYPLLFNSYCYNDSNRFVFSFAADTNIYETDLSKFNISYYGKSSLQVGNIRPIDKSEPVTLAENQRNYLTNDSYGEIYFDHFRKRYLRVALRKMSETEYKKRRQKVQSVIIFNKDLGIIGETFIPENLDIGKMFFTEDGCMYTQVVKKLNNCIQFIRLEYAEKPSLIANN